MASEDVVSHAGKDAQAFLALMADAVGVPTSDVQKLAPKLGMEPRDVYRWRNGEHGISLPHVMKMLKVSGALDALRRETRNPTTARGASDPEVAATVEALVGQAAQLTPLVNRLAQLLVGEGRAGSGKR